MQWLMQSLRGLMNMFVCERNIAGSRTPTRPCDGLVRAWARAHDVLVVFLEGPCCSGQHRACVQDMEEGRCSGVHVHKGGNQQDLETRVGEPICLFTYRRLGLSFTVLF